jgi:hypothetical protein
VQHRGQRRDPVHHRGVNHLAAPRQPTLVQRGENAQGEVDAAPAEVGEQVQRRQRRRVSRAEREDAPGDGGVVDVVARLGGARSRLPPAGGPAVDQAGVGGEQLVRSDAELLGGAGPHSLEEHLGLLDQPQQHRAARGAAQVNADAPVAAGARVVLRRQPGDRRRAAGPVHPDHLGAEIAQQHHR